MHLLTYMSFNLIVFSSFQYIYRITELVYSKVIYYSSMVMYQTLFKLSQLLDCCCSFPYLTIMNTNYKNLYAERISPSYVISLVYILKCSIPETMFNWFCCFYHIYERMLSEMVVLIYNVNIFPHPDQPWLL